MNLRILLVIDSFFPGTGGTERQLAQLAPKLADQGHHVEILCPRLVPEDMAKRSLVNGIPVTRISYPHIPKLGSFLMLIRFAWLLLTRYRNVDVIHVHIVDNMALVVALLRRFTDARLVAKISGATELAGGFLDPTRKGSRFVQARIALFRRFDYVQVISRQTYQALLDSGFSSNQLAQIPNGVDLARFLGERNPMDTRRHYQAVYAGRLAHVKGVDVLLRAWATIVAKRTARLIILGDGPDAEALQALAKTLGISQHVEFVGDCDNVAAYLGTADIYVQPSRDEGLPNAVLEAMAAGLPVVASDVGGNRDLVEDGVTGILVRSESIDELAGAISRMLEETSQRSVMGEQARQKILAEYSMTSVVDRLLLLYSPNIAAA